MACFFHLGTCAYSSVLAPPHSAVQQISSFQQPQVAFSSLGVVESYASEVVLVKVVSAEGWREQVEFTGVEFAIKEIIFGGGICGGDMHSCWSCIGLGCTCEAGERITRDFHAADV